MDQKHSLAGKTFTLEFFIDDDRKLRVVYNSVEYEFTDFWKRVDEADDICMVLAREFRRIHPGRMKGMDLKTRDWREALIMFINSHLSEKDRILDVMLRSSGEITVRLER